MNLKLPLDCFTATKRLQLAIILQLKQPHSSSQVAKIHPQDMNGLEPSLLLSKGAFVMLTMNIWPAVGLCNGSTGKIVDIIYHPSHQPPDLPIAVIVQFDDYIGPSISNETPLFVPIVPVTVSVSSTNLIHERKQMPLKLAWALTIHKSQGLTLPKAWINLGKTERTLGITYVALSRVKQLSSLVIEPMMFDTKTNQEFQFFKIQTRRGTKIKKSLEFHQKKVLSSILKIYIPKMPNLLLHNSSLLIPHHLTCYAIFFSQQNKMSDTNGKFV